LKSIKEQFSRYGIEEIELAKILNQRLSKSCIYNSEKPKGHSMNIEIPVFNKKNNYEFIAEFNAQCKPSFHDPKTLFVTSRIINTGTALVYCSEDSESVSTKLNESVTKAIEMCMKVVERRIQYQKENGRLIDVSIRLPDKKITQSYRKLRKYLKNDAKKELNINLDMVTRARSQSLVKVTFIGKGLSSEWLKNKIKEYYKSENAISLQSPSGLIIKP
jgi:hypothetical protein